MIHDHFKLKKKRTKKVIDTLKNRCLLKKEDDTLATINDWDQPLNRVPVNGRRGRVKKDEWGIGEGWVRDECGTGEVPDVRVTHLLHSLAHTVHCTEDVNVSVGRNDN